MNKLTAEQKKAVNAWIEKYGRQCDDDCQMIDDICYDLDLHDCEREIEKIVKLYFTTRYKGYSNALSQESRPATCRHRR